MQAKNNSIGFIVLVVLLSVAGVFSLKLFLQQRRAQDKLDIRTFPYAVGDWQGKDLEITEQEYKILETRNLISREYSNRRGECVSLFIIYSETNRAVFHPPEVCMLGSGLIVDKQAETVEKDGVKFTTNKLYTTKADYRGITLYSYKAGNLYTHNFYLQQIKFALNQLLGRHQGGATIRVSMALKENEATTLGILKDFLVQSIRLIEFSKFYLLIL